MQKELPLHSLTDFYVIGINYEKTNTSVRGLFSIDEPLYSRFRKNLPEMTNEVYLLSTCNRTEMYGLGGSPRQVAEVFCRETPGKVEDFLRTAYILRGEDALRHFLKVSCGLDSQILGDFEITAQVKKASKKSREAGLLGAFTERLINTALQVSKQVKNRTKLSSGTTSVSFAAIKYLRNLPHLRERRIVLFGLGKIGQTTCKNLITYLGTRNITLVNRTQETAKEFAEMHGLRYAPMDDLGRQLRKADIILVATNAPDPTILAEDVAVGKKTILDLSIPKNVSDAVRQLPQTTLVDVDELSKVQDQTLGLRRKEIPQAEAIVEEGLSSFIEWCQMRKNALVLKGMKEKMEEIQLRSLYNYQKGGRKENMENEELAAFLTQKLINVFGGKLKEVKGSTDHYYQILGELFEIPITKDEK